MSLQLPGFVDLHVHGREGRDFLTPDPAEVSEIARSLARLGVTGWLATYATAPVAEVLDALAALRRARDQDPLVAATCCGVHLEGPFLNPARAGAQRPDALLAPDLTVLARLLDAAEGLGVSLITLAPELEGAEALMAAARARGALVNLGHSQCSHDQAVDAFRRHQAGVTHLFNAMPGLHHRQPGLVGAALSEGTRVELIADGTHLSPVVLGVALRTLGERAVVVSDSHPLAGAPPGQYRHWGADYEVRGPREGIEAGGTLGGSSLPHPEMLRLLVEQCGFPPAEAAAFMSTTPARWIGLGETRGHLGAGSRGDRVELDEAYRVLEVQAGGAIVHGAG